MKTTEETKVATPVEVTTAPNDTATTSGGDVVKEDNEGPNFPHSETDTDSSHSHEMTKEKEDAKNEKDYPSKDEKGGGEGEKDAVKSEKGEGHTVVTNDQGPVDPVERKKWLSSLIGGRDGATVAGGGEDTSRREEDDDHFDVEGQQQQQTQSSSSRPSTANRTPDQVGAFAITSIRGMRNVSQRSADRNGGFPGDVSVDTSAYTATTFALSNSIPTTNAPPSPTPEEPAPMAERITTATLVEEENKEVFHAEKIDNKVILSRQKVFLLIAFVLSAIVVGIVLATTFRQKADANAQLASGPVTPSPTYAPTMAPTVANGARFEVDKIVVNDGEIVHSFDSRDLLTVKTGDKLKIHGRARSCGQYFCPTCITQLYVTLTEWNDDMLLPEGWDVEEFANGNPNNLTVPAALDKYCYAGQVLGYDADRTVCEVPSMNHTNHCFNAEPEEMFHRDCTFHEFNETFLIDLSYTTDTEYAVSLSNSYQFLCQSSFIENHLQYVSIGGDDQNFRFMVEPSDWEPPAGGIAPPTQPPLPREWDLQVDGVHVTTAITCGSDGGCADGTSSYYHDYTTEKEEGSLVVSKGDTLRFVGEARICSKVFCPTCMVQLYITMEEFHEDMLYENATDTYCFAGQVTGSDPDRSTCKSPSRETTGICFVGPPQEVPILNRNCTYQPLDTTIVIDDNYSNTAEDGSVGVDYVVALTNSYAHQCQPSYAENILHYLSLATPYKFKVV